MLSRRLIRRPNLGVEIGIPAGAARLGQASATSFSVAASSALGPIVRKSGLGRLGESMISERSPAGYRRATSNASREASPLVNRFHW